MERLGSQTGEAPGTYGKISEIVLGENSSNVIFSNLNLKSFYVEVIGGFVDGTSSGLYMKVNGIYVIGNAGVALPNSLEKGCYIRFVCENDGIYSVQATKSASGNDKPFNSQASMAIDNIFPPSAKNYETLSPINKIELFTSTGTTKQWLKGSSFTLYGIESEVTQ